MSPCIDVAVLSRSSAALDPRVLNGLRRQQHVALRGHRVVGALRACDPNRWAAIARARNHAVDLGDSPWLMFVDDDVLLADDAIYELYRGLLSRPRFAALAADYVGESSGGKTAEHVTMGATLFRREALRQIDFRWENEKCECRCCCEDLRGLQFEIDYLQSARAVHLSARHVSDGAYDTNNMFCRNRTKGRILAAFNRRHLQKFRTQFLRSLRASGNRETVFVAAYGLYPGELRQLRRLPGVEVTPLPVNGVMPPIRRLADFQRLIQEWPDDSPVAYWDAGDVVFQADLQSLWRLTQQFPRKLLAVREPKGYPHNAAVTAWTLSICHPESRRRAFDLFSRNPFLNSGFAAGTAWAMRRYLSRAGTFRSSNALAGTSDWGDQTALNLYCHSEPDAWQEIPQGWNYCLHDRLPGEVRVSPSGRVATRTGTEVFVAHGNACSLRKLAITRDATSSPQHSPDDAAAQPATSRPAFKIVMFSTSHIHNYATIAERINRAYCEYHGYEFVHEQYDSVQLSAADEKVFLMKKHLGSAKYLVWLDSDACVIDFAQRLEDFCVDDRDFVIAGHEFGFDLKGRRTRYELNGVPCGVNGGVFMIRSSEWSREFLDTWWRQCQWANKAGTAFREQGQLQQMLMHDVLKMQAHTTIVTPCSRLNRCDDNNDDVCEFILHLWGLGSDRRERVFSEIENGQKPELGISMPRFNVAPLLQKPIR